MRNILTVMLLTAFLCACGASPQSVSHYFGNMNGLKREYAGEYVDVFINPKADLAVYQFIRPAQLTVEFAPDADLSKMDAGDVEKMQAYFRSKLLESLAPRLQSVDFPEEGVLEVKAVIRNFTPGTPIMSLLSRDVLKYKLYLTNIRADLVFTDAASGDVVVAVLDRGLDELMFRDKEFVAQLIDVQNGFDAWVREVSAGINRVLPERQPMPVSLPAAPDTNTDMLQLPQQPVIQPTVWDQI